MNAIKQIIRIPVNKCYYCNISVCITYKRTKDGFYKKSSKLFPDSITKDHKHPKSKGGKKTVVCCKKCNDSKGDMSAKEFIEKKL